MGGAGGQRAPEGLAPMRRKNRKRTPAYADMLSGEELQRVSDSRVSSGNASESRWSLWWERLVRGAYVSLECGA